LIASHSNSDDKLHFNQRLLAGSFSGFCTQTIIYPLEFIKTRLIIAQTGQYHGIMNSVVQIYRTQGLISFYRGYLPSVIGTVPTVAINLSVYEVSRRYWLLDCERLFVNCSVRIAIQTFRNYCMQQGMEESKFKKLIFIGSSVISCFVSAFVTYPLFFVRTKMQIQEQNVSLTDIVRSIRRKHGVSGFYRGFTVNFVKSVPSITITYVFYEYMREKLGAESER
jgi:solute carrier family 25 phosphate transporter 23/24/25/41